MTTTRSNTKYHTTEEQEDIPTQINNEEQQPKMSPFQKVHTIETRDQLTIIWNYWLGKRDMLQMNNSNQSTRQQIEQINVYILLLKARDKQLISINRSNAAKSRAEKKAKEEAEKQAEITREQLEFDTQHPKVLIEVEEQQNKKAQLLDSIQEIETQLKELKKSTGVYDLERKIKRLKKDYEAPIKTSCKHLRMKEYRKQINSFISKKMCACISCGYEREAYEEVEAN